MFGVGSPAWEYDRNGKLVDLETLVNLVYNSRGNTWRTASYQNSSMTGYYTNLKNYCANKLNLVIQTLSPNDGTSAGIQAEANIIKNVGTAQTDWINNWSSIINALNPYAIMVMNEPSVNGAYRMATQSEFTQYRNFCMNCINAWRAIKPNIVIIVHQFAWNAVYGEGNNTYDFVANPLPYSNILYTAHYYYAYNNIVPPPYQPEGLAYWNNKQVLTPAQRANAKQLLTNYITNASSKILAKGQKFIFDEWGSCLAAPNSGAFAEDFVSIANSLNIGSIIYDIVPASYESVGILNEDYKTFNAVGLSWAGTETETITLPFHDNFATLDQKWKVINGNWQVI